jgi:hypothetical protein
MITNEKRFELAQTIVAAIAAYEARQLKRGSRDYITGMITAYRILTDIVDNDAALAQIRIDAARGADDEPKFELVD